MKLAIVGAGPSGFYVASRLLSLLPQGSSPNLRIHLYDRLWAPHGLVRYGVAPDHPEVKNCTHKFDATAKDSRFRFFGNVDVGFRHKFSHTVLLPLASIAANYSHLLFATGCTLPTLHPSLPISKHCMSALSIVHWYTRHPSNPDPPLLHKMKHIVLVGNGNVSLDVARLLLSEPSDLMHLDLPTTVLDVLSRSTVKHISIVARRGPMEAAFTVKELRELMNLPTASLQPLDPAILVPPPGIKLSRQQSRTLQLLAKGSRQPFGSTTKTWSLDFFRSPLSLTEGSSGMVNLSLAHTSVDTSSGRAISNGEESNMPTSLVVTSLGFQGDSDVPFYDSTVRHINSDRGRVLSPSGLPYRNLYTSGWAANGAKGVIASTMNDAYNVADLIASDAFPQVSSEPEVPNANPQLFDEHPEIEMKLNPDTESLPKEIRAGIANNMIIGYQDWKAVDSEEMRRGETRRKERERMDWREVVDFRIASGT